MNHFHIKSIILGIGIGIILTSVTSIIYLAGAQPKMELSSNEIVNDSGKEPETTGNKSNSAAEVVSFFIGEGESLEKITEKLYETGLISSKKDFTSLISQRNLETKIKTGLYYIQKGTDINEIINTITKAN